MPKFNEQVLKTNKDGSTVVRRDYFPVPIEMKDGKEILPKGYMRVTVPHVGVCTQKPGEVVTITAPKEKK